MKGIIYLIILMVVGQSCNTSKSVFELSPQQSMLMTGKGPGQDGAINPYSKTRSIAIIENLGHGSFEARIQADGKIIDIVEVAKKEKKEVILEPGYELYLDTEMDTKAKVSFKKY